MPVRGTLISVKAAQYDVLEQRGRASFLVTHPPDKPDKIGELVHVVCDDDTRECTARIIDVIFEAEDIYEVHLEVT